MYTCSVRVRLCIHDLCVCAYVYMFCVCVPACVSVCLFVCMCVFVCARICIHVLCLCAYLYMFCVCAYVYMFWVCALMYTCFVCARLCIHVLCARARACVRVCVRARAGVRSCVRLFIIIQDLIILANFFLIQPISYTLHICLTILVFLPLLSRFQSISASFIILFTFSLPPVISLSFSFPFSFLSIFRSF